MQCLSFVFLFSFGFVVSISAVPPSPAGGGYLKIYAPGDYAYAPHHDDFDIASKKNGYTIEMWYYLKHPLQKFDFKMRQPYERWSMVHKSGSYEVFMGQSGNPKFRSETKNPGVREPDASLPNQWHYCAVTISDQYIQRAINDILWGKHITDGFLNLEDTDVAFYIGGGDVSAIAGMKGQVVEPWIGNPVWIPYIDGFIDEVRISNIVRYPRENINLGRWVDTIEVPEGRFEPDEHTLALWHFDFEGNEGSKWRDSSGNGHHLTYKGEYLNVRSIGKLPIIWGELKKQ